MRADMRVIKPIVFLLGLYPFARLVWLGLHDGLSANPVMFVQFSTGTWALVFLCITLGVTPLRRLTGLNWLVRLRRMIGLFAFFYALLHFIVYVYLDEGLDVGAMLHDLWQRKFITAGYGAFVIMLVLAVTSPQAALRRLGRRWQIIHRFIYLAAPLAVLHFWWMKAGKNDLFEPKIYLAIVVVLLGFRVLWQLVSGTKASAGAGGAKGRRAPR